MKNRRIICTLIFSIVLSVTLTVNVYAQEQTKVETPGSVGFTGTYPDSTPVPEPPSGEDGNDSIGIPSNRPGLLPKLNDRFDYFWIGYLFIGCAAYLYLMKNQTYKKWKR